ncbi:MAG: TauD/TfdA family dioxygenase [Pseudomonadota bacterium]
MALTITPSGASCGAQVTGISLAEALPEDLILELRAHWLEHKVLAFPDQKLSNNDLERFSACFGEPGDDPFFEHIEGHEHICAIRRLADERTPIFAEFFHTDWSFMPVPPAATVLYSITIPPQGGDTLFADQVAAFEALDPELRERVEGLTAVHSAALGYAPDGVYGDQDQAEGRSMNIIPSEKARETQEHPLVRTHRETGKKALFSSLAYIQSLKGMDKAESDTLLFDLYQHQSQEAFLYRHRWTKDMLVIWDNRSLLHAATGGYDGYDRLLHRMTVADTYGR